MLSWSVSVLFFLTRRLFAEGFFGHASRGVTPVSSSHAALHSWLPRRPMPRSCEDLRADVLRTLALGNLTQWAALPWIVCHHEDHCWPSAHHTHII